MINAIIFFRLFIFKGAFVLLSLFIGQQVALAQESNSVEISILNSIQQNVTGEGEMAIYQDVLLYYLMEAHIQSNKRNGLGGYRIQINQWSGQNSRGKALAKSKAFKAKFPEFDAALVYVPYEAPYYKLRVGDFRSRNEAFEFYNQVRRYFPNSYIVKTNIVYPKLMVKNEASEIH